MTTPRNKDNEMYLNYEKPIDRFGMKFKQIQKVEFTDLANSQLTFISSASTHHPKAETYPTDINFELAQRKFTPKHVFARRHQRNYPEVTRKWKL